MKVRNLITGAVIVAGLWLTVPAHAAPSCQVPAFLKQGERYDFTVNIAGFKATVSEIDKDACWIKVGNVAVNQSGQKGAPYTPEPTMNGTWINLNQLVGIKPVGQ